MSRFVKFFDTLQNFVTGLGMPGLDPNKSVQYIFTELDKTSLENMYRGDWLARKICDAPAEDMTREWRAWQANQKQIEAIETVEKTMDLQRKVRQWISKARLYGGAALVIGVDDGNDPSQPLDIKKCGKDCLKYVIVLNCWELNAGPRIYDVRDTYFSRPSYYTIATPAYGFENTKAEQPKSSFQNFFSSNVISLKQQNYSVAGPNATFAQIHPSRVIELPGNEMPDWRLSPFGGNWGDSVLQTVVDTMNSFTQTMQSIAAMVSDGKMDVVKIPDMALNLTTPGYKDKLIDRFTLSAHTKSAISALLIDKEEEWLRVTTSYAGLPMIMHEFITYISGAAGLPVSRLFGQAAGAGLQGGSTAGGPDDLTNYYDGCKSNQKNEIAPRIAVLDQVIVCSAMGRGDPNIHYDWNPLWQKTDTEKSAIAYQKAQTTQLYSSIGLINPDALREGVVNQLIEDGTYPGFDDAIEEFGAEPEEGDPTGGYALPGAAPPPPGEEPEGGAPNGKPKSKPKPKGDDVKDYDPDQERDDHGRWTKGGGWSSSGSIAEGVGAGIEAISGGTGGGEGGKIVSDKLVKAIEDHVEGMGGRDSRHGAGDLSEWITRTHRADVLKIVDDRKAREGVDFVLLHKGDVKTGMPTVWLLSWSKADITSIHDHLDSEVGVTVARGTVGNRAYATGPGYLEKAMSKEGLEIRTGESLLPNSETVTLKAPYIHEMYGTSEKGAPRDITVHSYYPPLEKMHYFKKVGGKLKYAGDWDESRVEEDVMVKDSLGCVCCAAYGMMRRSK